MISNNDDERKKSAVESRHAKTVKKVDFEEDETKWRRKLTAYESLFTVAHYKEKQIKLFYFIMSIIIKWNYNNWIIAEFCAKNGKKIS